MTETNASPEQTINVALPAANDNSPQTIDPLRRVFVPIEQRTSRGTIVFKTLDNRVYARVEEGGPMYRAMKKTRGKKARAHDKKLRRQARASQSAVTAKE